MPMPPRPSTLNTSYLPILMGSVPLTLLYPFLLRRLADEIVEVKLIDEKLLRAPALNRSPLRSRIQIQDVEFRRAIHIAFARLLARQLEQRGRKVADLLKRLLDQLVTNIVFKRRLEGLGIERGPLRAHAGSIFRLHILEQGVFLFRGLTSLSRVYFFSAVFVTGLMGTTTL